MSIGERIYTRLGGRKFVALVLLGGGAVAVDLTTDRGLTQHLATFLGLLYTIFAGANVINKKVTRQPAAPKSEAPAIDLSPIEDQLHSTQQLMATVAESTANTQKLLRVALNIPTTGSGEQR